MPVANKEIDLSHTLNRRQLSGIAAPGYLDLLQGLSLGGYAGWNLFQLTVENITDDASVLLLLLTAVLNIVAVGVAVRRNSLSYTAIFYFNIVFFVFAPIEQIRWQFDPLLNNLDVLHPALGVTLGWSALCALFLVVKRQAPILERPSLSVTAPSKLGLLWCASLAASSLGISVYGTSLFSSRDVASQLITERFDLSIGLMLTGTVFPFAFYSSLVGFRLSWHARLPHWRFLFLIALAASLLLNNVTILSRYQLAVLIFFGVFFWMGIRPWSSRFLLIALVVGTVASPLFHVFRSIYSSQQSFEYNSFFSTMDYDAFSMLCHTILHVQNSGIADGANLLSGILFFVPRAIWIDKLRPTPFYLMDSLSAYRGLWSSNLSEPLIAEGYFGFGAVGTVAVSCIFLALVNRLEEFRSRSLSSVYLFRFAFPIIALMLLRGSLIVGVSIVVGHLLALAMTVRLSRASGA
ncbi:hypothetical protein SAMN05216338_1006164 [Bradyrhizobium sp. Rc2d]|uniref:hypothetical protein n=1 Tax=Bradyrhizobium sp. Rc2d TaxID=1855321 RepID=UPI000890A581|nr:hypothetical protein [Bradyrhizobium sp. Rc2d]SDH20482.1 hypothetical protein SAMN05216338_1006164 [Bradyrhizobium sp. Rc2d]